MLDLTAIVSCFAVATFAGFYFRHVAILAMDFYHEIWVELQSVGYFHITYFCNGSFCFMS